MDRYTATLLLTTALVPGLQAQTVTVKPPVNKPVTLTLPAQPQVSVTQDVPVYTLVLSGGRTVLAKDAGTLNFDWIESAPGKATPSNMRAKGVEVALVSGAMEATSFESFDNIFFAMDYLQLRAGARSIRTYALKDVRAVQFIVVASATAPGGLSDGRKALGGSLSTATGGKLPVPVATGPFLSIRAGK